MTERVYVALGSNLGDRGQFLAFARDRLGALPSTRLVATSAVEETVPLGGPPQGPYLNQMVLLETGLTPRVLLEAAQAIESAAGRERSVRWAPRTLDIDLVQFGNRDVRDPDLIIPHPELSRRTFWQREITQLESDER